MHVVRFPQQCVLLALIKTLRIKLRYCEPAQFHDSPDCRLLPFRHVRFSCLPRAKALELASETFALLVGQSLITCAGITGAGAHLRRRIAALLL